MTETPYPLPASTRQTDWLLGNGGTTYGPFGEGWGIFDTDDVKVETRPAAGGAVSLATVTVTKTVLAERYGTFSITFPAAMTAATAFRVTGLRLHERDLAVTRGGSIDGLALEQELSKVAVVLQEQRRDVDGVADRVADLENGMEFSAEFLAEVTLLHDETAVARDNALASEVAADADATAADTSRSDAQIAAAAADVSADIATLASLANTYFPGAQTNLPRGIVLGAVAVTAAGSGGTNGTFALAFTGGNMGVNPVGTFTVAGGALTAISITSPGLYVGAAITVPTLSFAASAGLTGATGAALAADFLVAAGKYYWTDHATDLSLVAMYYRSGSSAVISVGPDGKPITLPKENYFSLLGTSTLGKTVVVASGSAQDANKRANYIGQVAYDAIVDLVHFAGNAGVSVLYACSRDGVTNNYTPLRSRQIKMAAGVNNQSGRNMPVFAGEHLFLYTPNSPWYTSGLGAGVPWITTLTTAPRNNVVFPATVTSGLRFEIGVTLRHLAAAKTISSSLVVPDVVDDIEFGMDQADFASATAWSGAIEVVEDEVALFDGYITEINAKGTNAGTLGVKVVSRNASDQYTLKQSASFAVAAGTVTVLPAALIPVQKGDLISYSHTGVLHYINDGTGSRIAYFNLPGSAIATNTAPSSNIAVRIAARSRIQGVTKGLATILGRRVTTLEGGVSAWSGKKWGALGTSITAGDSWMSSVAANLGLTMTDLGVGGGRITTWAASGGEITAQIASLPTDAALVTLEGAVNDIWTGAPLGVYTDKVDGTFYGAMWAAFGAIRARCPNALIVVLVDWNTSSSLGSGAGNTQEAQDTNAQGLSPWHYQEAMVRIARMAGLNVILMTDAAMGYFTPLSFYADHIHQSATGNTRLATLVETELRKLKPYV